MRWQNVYTLWLWVPCRCLCDKTMSSIDALLVPYAVPVLSSFSHFPFQKTHEAYASSLVYNSLGSQSYGRAFFYYYCHILFSAFYILQCTVVPYVSCGRGICRFIFLCMESTLPRIFSIVRCVASSVCACVCVWQMLLSSSSSRHPLCYLLLWLRLLHFFLLSINFFHSSLPLIVRIVFTLVKRKYCHIPHFILLLFFLL